MTKWTTCELETACKRLSSGKGISAKMIVDKGEYPVYGGNGIRGYTSTSNFRGDCAIVGRQGAYCGNVRYFKGEAYMTEHAVVVCANDDNCTRYLAYLLSTMNLGRLSGQSAQPGLSVKTLGKQEIRIPPKDIQIKISELLGALDDKIKHNEEINDNLAQQAQSIFAHLFPNILSTDGNATLEQLITFSNGKKRPQSSGDIPVYGGNGILAYTSDANAENCVIVGRVGAYCGNTFLCTGRCWVSDNAIQAKSKSSDAQMFTYYLLSNAALPSRHIGTGQPLMTQGILNAIPITLPKPNQVELFNDTVAPIQNMIDRNKTESNHLSMIRDALLPKLMSGELDVSNLNL